MRVRTTFLFLLAMLLFCFGHAQYILRDSFLIANGMPSEYLYQSIVDQKGFLWVASERGVIRYDGKRFELFDTRHGLPDINIVNIAVEKDGTLWARSVSGDIAYLNYSTQRFESNRLIKSLKPFKVLEALQDGGIHAGISRGGCFILNRRPLCYLYNKEFDSSSVLHILKDGSLINYKLKENRKSVSLYLIRDKRIVEKKDIAAKSTVKYISLNNYNIYLFDSLRTTIILIKPSAQNHLQVERKEIKTKKVYYFHTFSGNYLLMHYRHKVNDKDIVDIDLYDKNSLKFLYAIGNNVLGMDVLNDLKKNVWFSSGKGLYRFSQPKEIVDYLPFPYSKKVFYSAYYDSGVYYFGNEAGEIIEYRNRKFYIHKVTANHKTEWQRHILVIRNNVFSFSDGGIALNYTKSILYHGRSLPAKDAVQLNDSIIIISNDNELYKLNTYTMKIERHSSSRLEQCLARISSSEFLVGSVDGLFICDVKDTTKRIAILPEIFKVARPSALIYSADGLLVVGTVSNGIYFLRKQKVIAHLTQQQQLKANEIRTLTFGNQNEIIAGTFSGISRIQYRPKNDSLIFSVQNISGIDGLTSETVNRLLFDGGKLFAMTDKGISYIPEKVTFPSIDIELTEVLVNQVEQSIKRMYNLSYLQKDISISFSGVDIDRYYDHAQYSTDQGLNWYTLNANDFQIQWESGVHYLWLRAVDVNKNVSNRILKLQFTIQTPYYRSWWFRLIILLLILSIAIIISTLYAKRKQQRRIDELLNQQALDELEIQALKAQMNPHFVFNCLNSIKGFIYDEDFEMADLYLDKFAQLLRSTLDYSSQPSISLKKELEYIDTYLMLEKLRFGNKFDYEIRCLDDVAQNDIAIPAMILQPYVENAIKHGVCNLDDGLGKIKINVYLAEEKLHIDIEDNGVGRAKANEMKQQRRITHESKGTQLTERRIELYQIGLTITDKKDEAGNPAGTRIHLVIPIPLNQ